MGQQCQTVSCEVSDSVAITAVLEEHTVGRSGKARKRGKFELSTWLVGLELQRARCGRLLLN